MIESDNTDLLELFMNVQGIRMLFTIFFPGFIFISCFKHWFGFFKKLKEIEIIFWSIPLSFFLNVILVIVIEIPAYILDYKTTSPIGLEILIYNSALIFLFLFGLYLKNSKKTLKKLKYIISFMSFYFSLIGYFAIIVNQSGIYPKINGDIIMIIVFLIPFIISYKIWKSNFSITNFLKKNL